MFRSRKLYPEVKKNYGAPPITTFGQVPVLKIGGGYISQRKALVRWAGRVAAIHKTGGLPLYPVEDVDAALAVDGLLDEIDDIVEGALDPTEFFIVRTSNCRRHLCSYLEALLLCMYSALLWLCFVALLWPCFALAGPARGWACCSRAVGVAWERRGRI